MTQMVPESGGMGGDAQTPVPKNSFIQTNAFVARDRGRVNRPNKHFKLTEHNTPLSLTNTAQVGPNEKVIHLPITEITTGWRLSGETTQSAMHKSFYPRNMGQEPITVKGTMPNQYEYDRLVHFVTVHHQTVLGLGKFYPVTYVLRKRTDQVDPTDSRAGSNRIYAGRKGDVVITGIRAGHQRFVYAVPFELELLVVRDQLDFNVHDEGTIYSKLIKRYTNSLLSESGPIQPTPDEEEVAPIHNYWEDSWADLFTIPIIEPSGG